MSEQTNEQVQAEPCCKVQFSGECVGRAVDAFAASLESVICGRGQPLVVRVSKETMAKLDMLVQGKVCKSRSEAALFRYAKISLHPSDHNHSGRQHHVRHFLALQKGGPHFFQ